MYRSTYSCKTHTYALTASANSEQIDLLKPPLGTHQTHELASSKAEHIMPSSDVGSKYVYS